MAGVITTLLGATALAAPSTTTYGYDPLGQLVASVRNCSAETDYSFDSAGNRTAVDVGAAPTPSTPPRCLSTSPHRYWRVRFSGSMAGCANVAVAEMELFDKLGGPNLLDSATLSSSALEGGQGPDHATDAVYGNLETWNGAIGNYSTADQAGSLYADFSATPRVINHVVLTALEAVYAGGDPNGFNLQFSDVGGTDDAAWNTAWSAGPQPTWANFERRRFDRPGYADPAYSGSPHGAHRFWRISLLDSASPYYGFGLADLEFRAAPGGADQVGSGSPIESTQYQDLGAANLFDHDPSTIWGISFGRQGPVRTNHYVGYDFGSGNAVTVAQVALRSRPDSTEAAGQAPSLWMLQFSDDGTTWSTAAQFQDQAAWSASETRLYTDPLYVQSHN